MTTKAFTFIAVRLVGLVALLKGAIGIPVLLWAMLQFARNPKAAAASVGRLSMLNIAFSIALPLVVGLICLMSTKPIAELIAKGADEGPAPSDSGN